MNIEQDDTTIEPSTLQPGTLLKNKREELGLSQKQISDRLRLRLSIITSIERNEFDSEQVATFTRGYLRSYAKAVGITDKEILHSYQEHCKPPVQEQPMQSFSKKTKREKHDHRIMTITWAILIVLIGMSSLWWWQNSHQDTLTPQEAGATTEPSANESSSAEEKEDFATVSGLTKDAQDTSTEAQAPADEPESAEPAQPAESTDVQATEDTQSTTADDTAAVEDKSEQVPEAPEQSTANLETMTMSFSADCWIQVTDATGKTLVTGIKKEGQSLTLHGEKPFKVVLGAPEAVQMTFASEPVDLSRYTSGKVARLTLP